MSVYVIMGPPCSGKSTYALEHAGPHDVVVDMDRLAVALSGRGAPTHGHTRVIDRLAYVARRAVLDEALNAAMNSELEVSVYIVHTNPGARDKHRYTAVGAEVITLDPGREVVEQRCREMRPESSMEGVRRWYARPTGIARSRNW